MLDRPASGQRGEIRLQRVAGNRFEPAGIVVRDLGKCCQAALVALDGDDAFGAMHQQRAGQAAGAGADLDDRGLREVAGGPRDLAGQIEVEQEILAERFLRLKPMTLDDFTQRRQAVEAHRTAVSLSARNRASCSAAIRLSGRAMPFPAMSKAVP